MTFSYLALGWKQNIEDATWVLIIVSSKVLEEREDLKKELLGKKEFKLFGRFSTYLDCKKNDEAWTEGNTKGVARE